jgi:hypothetical protein
VVFASPSRRLKSPGCGRQFSNLSTWIKPA